MCGICGFNWKDRRLAEAMADAMVHRGPDQSGVFSTDEISLGHRRLSIIDLSEHGRQPMSNEDGTVHLVFNGEIYNFQEVRAALTAKGHRFASQADSEVILHGYEEYGERVLDHLRGMFAFALWDQRTRTLFLARDRLGIKPLYYYHEGGRFIFASEIKAILRHRDVPRELNHQALYEYLGFEFVPAADTMFRHIRKLPAGHYLVLREGRLDIREYWDLRMGDGRPPLSYGAAVENVRELLDYAVKSHLVSDVPLGVFLSGGLDSSAIVAAMRRHISGPLRTFTIGYPDKTFSELDYAKQVAERFETEHHVLMIEDLNQRNIEKACRHLDEPMTDLSAVPLMLVCEKAKEFVTVCLSGEGGDESLAGYDRFKASRIDRFYSLIPRAIRRHALAALAARLPDRPQKKGAINMIKRFVEGSELPPDGEHLRWQYFGGKAQDDLLFSETMKQQIRQDPFRLVRQYAAKSDTPDRVNHEIYLDMRFMMTDSVLMKVDKMSMASSLEIRVPLLDHVFVEFIASLPGAWKLSGLNTKAIFRSALSGMLPETIVNRGKQGYSLPVKQLLRTQLKDYMISLLHESPLIRENMNADYVDRLIREHLALTRNHNHALWALMNAAIWHNTFMAA